MAINDVDYYPQAQTIPDFIDEVCQLHADKAAFYCLGKTYRYRDIDRLSRCFAYYLQQVAGMRAGDRVAIQLPNLLQYPVVAYGVWRAGLVVVNVNPQYSVRELQHQLCDSGARMLVVLDSFAHIAQQALPQTAVECVVTTSVGDLHGLLSRQLINWGLKYIKRAVKPYRFANSISLRAALRSGIDLSAEPIDGLSAQSTAVLQYTGGTTGVSKGAQLSHANLLANMRQIRRHFAAQLREDVEIFICPLPLYHIYAHQFSIFVLPSAGGLSVLIPDPRNLSALLKTLARFSFSGFLGINTLFAALCRQPQFAKLDFSALHLTSSGGMALNTDIAKQWADITGCAICEGYGMSETSPVITANRSRNNRPGTVGPPLPDTELKLIDPRGEPVAAGEAGELCVKGPQVMSGYWNMPAETAKVLSADGWLHTGDIAQIEPDGFLRIVDRLKDMIIVSGFNVYPNEVEDVLVSHPQIVEAAVVGVADEHSGEVVKAYLVTTETLDLKALRHFCRQQLSPYKVPKHFAVVDALPKSNVGKVLRRELKEQA